MSTKPITTQNISDQIYTVTANKAWELFSKNLNGVVFNSLEKPLWDLLEGLTNMNFTMLHIEVEDYVEEYDL